MQQKLRHKSFEKLLKFSKAINIDGYHMPIILTGPAGTSKSRAAEDLAEELGLPFGYLPMNQQTTKSDLLGFISPNGDAVMSLFGKFYTKGGVFVLEEMDAANNNVLLAINAAIAGDQGFFAGKMHKRHKDFVLVATANTYGGSDEEYIARSKLDASTLSRFIRLDWELDTDLEAKLINDSYIVKVITDVREKLKHYGLVLSMRDALTYTMLIGIGLESEEAAASTLLRELDKETREDFVEVLKIDRPSTEPLEVEL